MDRVHVNILGDWIELNPDKDVIEGIGVNEWLELPRDKQRKFEYMTVNVGGRLYELHQSYIVISR